MNGLWRRLSWPYRRATSRARALPDFIVVGAQKAGTSSLFHGLSQHPQIFPSAKKEVHFFDGGLSARRDTWRLGEGWYRAHFPRRVHLAGGGRTGEASPLYLFHPLAPNRMFDLVPNARLIALLRSPTERAISHYFHTRAIGLEPLPLAQALDAEDERLAPDVPPRRHRQSVIHHSYRSRGRYAEQLERYFERWPREQILVLSSEVFFREPAGVLAGVFSFLGVDPAAPIRDLSPRNATPHRTAVPAGVREKLDAYFAPHNDALERLLGRSFDW